MSSLSRSVELASVVESNSRIVPGTLTLDNRFSVKRTLITAILTAMHGPTPTPPSRRYNPLLAVAAAFLTGILVDRSIATVTLAMWVALCVLALFLAWRFRRQQA
ncbi:MAG: hypothetical protein RID07_17690, partial [Lacipirellulaceae bacterium]